MRKRFRVPILLCTILLVNLNKALCQKEPDLYSQQNIALIDAMIRSLDIQNYVRELFIIDFRKTEPLPIGISFEQDVFKDDGTGNDKIKGDGIYTSINKYKYNDKVLYSKQFIERSVNDYSIYDRKFLYKSELNNYLGSYSMNRSTGVRKIKISVDCDFYICRCSWKKCWCLICDFYLVGSTPINGCVVIKNCHIDVEFEW